MTPPPIFVGIDVSKAALDVAVRPAGTTFRLGNDPAGLAELVERLRPLAPALVVLEATGGYEAPAVAALQVAGIPAAAINPRQARDFARATGRLAKTDRIDAEALAHFAEAVRPEPRPAGSAEQRSLAALLSRRGQLVEMRVMESNRLAACTDPDVRAGIGRHIAWLGAELEDADRRLAEAVRASPAWRERDELLRSIPGIGPVVSRTLLAALPELGTTDGGRLAALVGLAPYAADRAARYSTRRTAARPAEGLRRSAAVARQEGEGGADRGRPQAAGHRQRGRPLRPPVAAGVGDGTLIDLGSPLNHDFAP